MEEEDRNLEIASACLEIEGGSGTAMPKKKTLNLPVHRVEGDLEVRVELENGIVSDAWCTGTMYRGFENIMVGRGALDGLVITPRVCGLCSNGLFLFPSSNFCFYS